MDKLLTVEQVVDWLKLDRQRVYDLARQGIIPSVRLGRQLRFSEQQISDFIESGGKAFSGGWRKEV